MGGSLEAAASSFGRNLRKQRLHIMQSMLSQLNTNMSVIDMGCGNGSTLKVIRDAGFNKSIGIEYIEKGIIHAEENGFKRNIDVFKMDAKNTTYPDRAFDIVFSEGLWEHFEDPTPFIREFARISKSYIMVIQPNHFSVVGFIMKVGWELLNSKKGGVKEYSFRLEYFEQKLKELNFKLVQQKTTKFNEQAVMLFERVNK